MEEKKANSFTRCGKIIGDLSTEYKELQKSVFDKKIFQYYAKMYAEYDPISLFKHNSCFHVNIQTCQKGLFSKMKPFFKILYFIYKIRFLIKFLTLIVF